MTAAAEPVTLTAADRCDRCGARAMVHATLPFGELTLCGHHYAEHRDRLAEHGALVAYAETTPRPDEH